MSENRWRGWTSGFIFQVECESNTLGGSVITCFSLLLSLFHNNIYILLLFFKSEDTFCYTPERIWIHVHPCSTGMYLAANSYSQLPVLLVDRHRDHSDHCSKDCLWFCQHTEAPSVNHQKMPRSQCHSCPKPLGPCLLPVPMWGSQTKHRWAYKTVSITDIATKVLCGNLNSTWIPRTK